MRFRPIILFILTLAVLSACGGKASSTSSPLSTDTPIPLPTLSPTPVIPLAVLIIPADLDQETADLYEKTVYDLAQGSGMRFQVRNDFTAADLEPGLKIVIALSKDPGIAALAAAAPQVQFLAINIPNITPGGNISMLGNGSQGDVAAFLAGYTAALITDDYRVGMIIPKDNNAAAQALNAFANGMALECGVCRPFYVYPWTYPQYVAIPAEEDKKNYNAYADILLIKYKVQTVYIYPDVYTDDLATYIGTTGASLIGTVSPASKPAGWVMTIQPDIIKAIQDAWPQLINGQGGVTVQSPLGLADVDPTLLSPGKQRLVEEKLHGIEDGTIAIGTP